MHGMNNKPGLRRIIRDAVCLNDFDTPGTRLAMSPLGRIPQRPAELPGEPLCGAVLIVLFAETERLHTLLIKRCDGLRHHPGQVSFPGGRREKDEDPLACALRETREEIGIAPETLDIAGGLEPAYILASDFNIHAFVAWHPGTPVCRPDPHEVAAIIPVPLDLLCTPGARTYKTKNILGTIRTVPGFSFLEHHIWGATAILLHETIERLKMAGWQG
jgi:8-oxo-dGTP pyrophosphatase MutT (NUDIX family)